MAILKLPPLLVNQIAAGEVIERPASVVKELVENSLDAGPTRVEIAVEDGGRQLIQVSDNGGGIPQQELVLSVAPHATSKLTGPADLAAIATLGFRGEALASIASISRLRITSCGSGDENNDKVGHQIEAEGEHIGEPIPSACAPGTIVEVRDLFFNTPARRKFMRSAGTEFGHIVEAVTRIAMAWPEIGFVLTHNGRPTLDLAAHHTRRQRCVELLGKDLEEALLEVESVAPINTSTQPDEARLWGLAGVPSIARGSAKGQYICLNGRAVRDRNITHAIREAYRGLVPHDRYPVAVVMLYVEPTSVDINVHPTKAEVRFREPGRIHGLILTAIRQRLLGSDLTPTAQLPNADDRLPFENTTTGEAPSPGERLARPFTAAGERQVEARSVSSNDFVDFFKRMDSTQKGFVFQEVKRALAEEDPQAADEPTIPVDNRDEALLHDESHRTAPPLLASHGVLQIHKSYLVTEDEQGLIIVDQHALHERVIYEQLRRRVLGQGKDLESQRLLMPATLSATPRRLDLLEQIGPLLARLGIEAEPMGPKTIAVHAFPSLLFDRKVDAAEFVQQLLDEAEEGGLGPEAAAADANGSAVDEAVLHTVLDMMACKAAVKAGDQMNESELAELLARRGEIERSSNCPHGRPTSVRLSLRDLAKQFKRT